MVKEGTPEENWTTVFTTGYDYEAELVRDRLDDSGIPAVIYNKKDHAFNLTVGDLSPIAVNVPNEHAEEALALLADEPTENELDRAALEHPPSADSLESAEGSTDAADEPDDYLDVPPVDAPRSPEDPPSRPVA